MFWFWFFVAPALLLALLSLRGERKRAAYVLTRLHEPDPRQLPTVTLIVPLKGEDEGLRENLASLAALDYPNYELIITAQKAEDIPPGVLPGGVKVVLARNSDARSGEKIRNLLSAVEMSRKGSEVLAFADSDGRVSKRWLRALAAPLAEPGVGASTGYRWYMPDPPDFWSLLRSVWNAPIAGMLGPGANAFAWGGALAIRREVFFKIAVPDLWRNSVSDDYALREAVQNAGLSIAFAPGAMVACTDHVTARDFLQWARRQLVLTRVYRPGLWGSALVAHIFYCGAMAASIGAALQGSRGAEWALLAQLSPGMLKGANRAALAKAALPEYKTWFERYGWVHTWWVPLATWIWLCILAASALSNVIEWRGNRYNLVKGELLMAKGMDRRKEKKKPKKNKT